MWCARQNVNNIIFQPWREKPLNNFLPPGFQIGEVLNAEKVRNWLVFFILFITRIFIYFLQQTNNFYEYELGNKTTISYLSWATVKIITQPTICQVINHFWLFKPLFCCCKWQSVWSSFSLIQFSMNCWPVTNFEQLPADVTVCYITWVWRNVTQNWWPVRQF